MRDSEIMIGKTYRVREWDDMADEFGIRDGEIQCDASFIKSMKPLCGMIFTVKSMRDSNFGCYRIYEPEEPGFESWIITAHMLEPIEEEVVPEPSEDLFGFLLQ